MALVLRKINNAWNVYYIPIYTQTNSVNLYQITPTPFGVNTPSSGSLELC